MFAFYLVLSQCLILLICLNRSVMSEHCIHEQYCGRVLSRIEDLYKDFYGNGQPGAMDIISDLKVKVVDLYEQGRVNATSLSAIAKFVTEMQAIDSYKKEEKLTASQRTAVIISAIIGVAGVLAAFLAI